MLSAATFEELRGYAARGHLGQRISLTLVPAQPRLGGMARLRWDFRHLRGAPGALRLPDGARIPVPSAGYRDIRVNTDPLVVHIAAGAEEARLEVRPIVTLPRVEVLHVPSRTVVGEAMTIRWRVRDAQSCRIEVTEGGLVRVQVTEARGDLAIVPRLMGEMRICLMAVGHHAALSPRARTMVEQRVEVTAPPVRMAIPCPEQQGEIGAEAEFRWDISGARQVLLQAGGEETAVPTRGSVFIEAGLEPEYLTLVAIGFDDRRHTRRMRLVPTALSTSGIAVDLRALDMPWR